MIVIVNENALVVKVIPIYKLFHSVCSMYLVEVLEFESVFLVCLLYFVSFTFTGARIVRMLTDSL